MSDKELRSTDPTLKRTSVQINYTASDGYRAEVGYSNARSGTPESVFIEAMDELSRLCHLFGFGEKARDAFDAAAKRVNDWRGVMQPSKPCAARVDVADLTPWEKARFGVFHPDGRFEELSGDGPWEDHPLVHTARWVGGIHDMQVLRAALSSNIKEEKNG